MHVKIAEWHDGGEAGIYFDDRLAWSGESKVTWSEMLDVLSSLEKMPDSYSETEYQITEDAWSMWGNAWPTSLGQLFGMEVD